MDERLNLLTEEEKQKIEAKVLYEEMLKAQMQQEQVKRSQEQSEESQKQAGFGTEIDHSSILPDAMIQDTILPILTNAWNVAMNYARKKNDAIETRKQAGGYAGDARVLKKSRFRTLLFQALHLVYVMSCFRVPFDPATYLDSISLKTYGELYLYIIESILAKTTAGPFGKIWIIILCETVLPLIIGYLLLTLFRFIMMLLRRKRCKQKAEKLYAEAEKIDEEAENYRKENEEVFFMLPDRYQSGQGIYQIINSFEQREALSFRDAFRLCDDYYKETFAYLGSFTVGKGYITHHPFGDTYEERLYF